MLLQIISYWKTNHVRVMNIKSLTKEKMLRVVSYSRF